VAISSMTGFARQEGEKDSCTWTWEIKSVNAKGLDVRARLPNGFERLEQLVRKRVQQRFKRGNISLNLNISWPKGDAGFRVNHEVLGELMATLPEIRKQLPDAEQPSIDGLLALRGVIEMVEENFSDAEREALDQNILSALDAGLDGLLAMRDEEGGRLASVLNERLDEIGGFCQEAEKLAAAQPEAIKKRLSEQVRAILDDTAALSEDRLAQEIAILASKADLREELDRLAAHRVAALSLMNGKSDGGVGRKLDFLCQEFNREANTLCSKSQDIDLTRVGLELKATIEQFREQVQNIE